MCVRILDICAGNKARGFILCIPVLKSPFQAKRISSLSPNDFCVLRVLIHMHARELNAMSYITIFELDTRLRGGKQIEN